MDEMEDVYHQFETFDFEVEDFQNGLENVYESYLDQQNQDKDDRIHEITTEIPPEEKDRLTIQAKTFFFCKATGNIMNIEDYEEWKSKQKEPAAITAPTATAEVEEPEYSSTYNEIVELILSGREKEIPGTKQIPDTVLEGHSSESAVDLRKKPWEVARETAAEKEKELEEATGKGEPSQ